jgi:hypothetical protein
VLPEVMILDVDVLSSGLIFGRCTSLRAPELSLKALQNTLG